MERGGACSLQGAASAWCELFISVEEFVPLAPIPVDLSSFDPGKETGATISHPGNPLAGRVFLRTVGSASTVILNHATGGLFGLQTLHRDASASTTFVMPITPGNTYRCWVCTYQAVSCHSTGPVGWAYSNFAIDLTPIFFAFAV